MYIDRDICLQRINLRDLEQKGKNKKKHKVHFSREDRLLLPEETIDDKDKQKGDTEIQMNSGDDVEDNRDKLTILSFKYSVFNWWGKMSSKKTNQLKILIKDWYFENQCAYNACNQ